MTDKEFSATKRRVQPLLREWIKRMKLDQWDISSKFRREPFESDSGSEAAAQVSVEWMYKLADIEFNVPNLADTEDLILERIVVHELCHILVNEMREFGDYTEVNGNDRARRHEERVVTDLALAFLQTKYHDKKATRGEVGE